MRLTWRGSAMSLGDSGVLAPGRWRWARALVWLVVLGALFSFVAYPGWARRIWPWPIELRFIVQLIAASVAFLVYALVVRVGERRRADEIAVRPMVRELAVGIAIGFGMFALVFAILRLSGAYTIAAGSWSDWPDDVMKTLATALREELLIRLIAFRLLIRAFGVRVALVLSAALFGAGHLGNPNASLVAAAAIAVEAGLMLAAFYLLTGRIWVSVGVHAAWNFAQGPIFGARISGVSEQGSLFVSGPVAGLPDWWTGGAFGPEASVPAMLIGLALFVLVYRAAPAPRN